MTNEDRNRLILQRIEAGTAAAVKSKKSARAALISEGIYTRDGTLTKEYGGSGSRKDADKVA
jgi:hypothetical protein